MIRHPASSPAATSAAALFRRRLLAAADAVVSPPCNGALSATVPSAGRRAPARLRARPLRTSMTNAATVPQRIAAVSSRSINCGASPSSTPYMCRPFTTSSPFYEKRKDGEETDVKTGEATMNEDPNGVDEMEAPPKKKKSLRESVDRLQGNETDPSSSSKNDSDADSAGGGTAATDETIEKLSGAASSFLSVLSHTWAELVQSGAPKDINKKIGNPAKSGDDPNYDDDNDAADKYEGTTAIMVVDPEEHLTAWERMERRLRDAPIIQNILERSEEVYVKSGAHSAKGRMEDLREDAQEAWETSQNPWVYRASSVYDTLTAESEFAAAVRELRVLDPEFALDDWKHDVVEKTLPRIMELFLEGRIKELQPWLGESVYNRLAAEVRARKKEGVQMDTNVLAIMNAEILTCEPDDLNKGSPIILLHYMCQQINCVRKKKSKGAASTTNADETKSDGDAERESGKNVFEEELGEIIEGGEDDIRANSYVVAFQREYDEKNMELNWKIVDFRFNGAIAYL